MASNKEAPSAFKVDWGAFAPLKLRSRAVAEGVYAGQHRSVKKGAGVEFGGQRPYVFGDDLRFIDRRALLRHDRLMIREFETETDRALWLVVDATLSMGFRGKGPGAKVAFAALLAAALSRVALLGGDPVGLVVLGGKEPVALRARAGRDAFDRLLFALESIEVAGDWAKKDGAVLSSLLPVYERARRGSVIVLLSDLIDLPPDALRDACGLATRGRRVYALQLLSPDEATLPFSDHARFVALEGDVQVEADPIQARAEYMQNLDALRSEWRRELVMRGGGLLSATTTDDAVSVIRQLLRGIAGAELDLREQPGVGT